MKRSRYWKTSLKNLRISAPSPTSCPWTSTINPSLTRKTQVKVYTRRPAVMKRTIMMILARNWTVIALVRALRIKKRQKRHMRIHWSTKSCWTLLARIARFPCKTSDLDRYPRRTEKLWLNKNRLRKYRWTYHWPWRRPRRRIECNRKFIKL